MTQKSINLSAELAAEQQSLLQQLIEQELVKKPGLKLKRGTTYLLDNANVSIVLSNSIVKRKSNHDKENPYRYEVLASKVNGEDKLGTGTCGKIKIALKTLILKQAGENQQLVSKEKIKAYKVIEFNSKNYYPITEDIIWGDDVFREGYYFGLVHGHTKEPVFRLDKDGQPQAYLFMPILTGADLNKIIRDPNFKVKDLSYRIQLILSVLDALAALHESNIIHCDIKSANLLWEEKLFKINITDFGYATHLKDSITSNCGTPKYVAPEAANNTPLTYKADIYSLVGVVADILGAPDEFFKNEDKPSPDSYDFNYLPELSQYLNDKTKYSPQELSALNEKFSIALKKGSTNDPEARCELTDIRKQLIEIQVKFCPELIMPSKPQRQIQHKISASKILGYVGLIALLLIGIALILSVKLAPLGIPIAVKACALIANTLNLSSAVANIITLAIGATATITSTLTVGINSCKNALLRNLGFSQPPKLINEKLPNTYKKLTECLGWNETVAELAKPSQENFTRSLFTSIKDNVSEGPTHEKGFALKSIDSFINVGIS